MSDQSEFLASGENADPQPIKLTEFRVLQLGLQRGDSLAMQQLFDDYSQRLVRLAGNEIHPLLRKRFDGEDIVQSVFRTFFRRLQEGTIRIEHSHQLWRLLATITFCKTRSHARRHTAEMRSIYAEQGDAAELQLLEREPLPEDGLALWEEIDIALDGLPDRAGEILSRRLDGKNKSEIASEMNLSRQTIHRILKLVEERLVQRFEHISSNISGKSNNS